MGSPRRCCPYQLLEPAGEQQGKVWNRAGPEPAQAAPLAGTVGGRSLAVLSQKELELGTEPLRRDSRVDPDTVPEHLDNQAGVDTVRRRPDSQPEVDTVPQRLALEPPARGTRLPVDTALEPPDRPLGLPDSPPLAADIG